MLCFTMPSKHFVQNVSVLFVLPVNQNYYYSQKGNIRPLVGDAGLTWLIIYIW